MAERPAPTAVAEWLGGSIDDALADVPVPAYLLDRDGLVRWENKRATELFGDVRGKLFWSIMAPEAAPVARTEFTKKILGNAKTSDYESVLLRPSGERVPVEVHSVALGDSEHVVGIFGLSVVDEGRALPAPLRDSLTPRQQEVLQHLARGASTAQIATQLGVSRETVRNHVRALLRRLRVHSRLEAVAEARRRGHVD